VGSDKFYSAVPADYKMRWVSIFNYFIVPNKRGCIFFPKSFRKEGGLLFGTAEYLVLLEIRNVKLL